MNERSNEIIYFCKSKIVDDKYLANQKMQIILCLTKCILFTEKQTDILFPGHFYFRNFILFWNSTARVCKFFWSYSDLCMSFIELLNVLSFLMLSFICFCLRSSYNLWILLRRFLIFRKIITFPLFDHFRTCLPLGKLLT